jgi:MFS family permease
VPHEKISFYSILIILMGFLISFSTEGALATFGKLLPEIRVDLDATLAQISLVGSLFAGIHFMMSPIAGAIINAFGFRKSGVAGAIVAGCGLFIASASTGFGQLLVGHAIAAFGTGTLSAAGNLCIGYYFDKYRPLAMGFSTSGTGFGTFFLAMLINLFIDENDSHHWNSFICGEATFLICMAFVVLLAAKPKSVTLKVEQNNAKTSWLQRVSTILERDLGVVPESRDTPDLESNAKRKVSFGPVLKWPAKIEKPKKFWRFSSIKKSDLRNSRKILRTTILDFEDVLFNQSSGRIAKSRLTELGLEPEQTNLEKRLMMIHVPEQVKTTSRWKKFKFAVVQGFGMIIDLTLFKSWSFCVTFAAVTAYAFGLFIPYGFLKGSILFSNDNL